MEFKSKLTDTYNALKDDYTADEIEDSLDDDIFFNDFAHQFGELLNDLILECERVMRGCERRKTELRKALIWGNM
jgi:hypothetical protein